MLILNRTPMSHVHNHLNELFNNVFSDASRYASPVSSAINPPMNVWEQENAFFIEAELPGYNMKDIDITVLGDEVTIKGERTIEDREGATWLRRERQAGSFTRSWTLPTEVDADKVEATFRDGVLLVTLPKTEKAMPRKIEVKVSNK